MKTIPLTKGYEAIVDDDDYERASSYKWYALVQYRNNGTCRIYATRHLPTSEGGRKLQGLHRFIVGDACAGLEVDHINGDCLDNRRENLRACTRAENQHNSRAQTHSSGRPVSSIFKGVTWRNSTMKWVAHIRVMGERKYLGVFTTEQEASDAYNSAAIMHFGEFAKLNYSVGE